MEEKIDLLIEEMRTLRIQIQKLVTQNVAEGEQTLVTYLSNKNEFDFKDKLCQDMYNDYIKFKDTMNPYAPNITQNMFNKTIKKVFPTLTVGVTTRHNKCVQYYKNK